LFGDLTDLPPIFLTASQGEMLLNDTTRLAEKAERAGVDVTLKIVDDSVHVYPIFPFLPETQSTMDDVANWSKRCFRRNEPGRTIAAE
jgi:salicylate hydroxylase